MIFYLIQLRFGYSLPDCTKRFEFNALSNSAYYKVWTWSFLQIFSPLSTNLRYSFLKFSLETYESIIPVYRFFYFSINKLDIVCSPAQIGMLKKSFMNLNRAIVWNNILAEIHFGFRDPLEKTATSSVDSLFCQWNNFCNGLVVPVHCHRQPHKIKRAIRKGEWFTPLAKPSTVELK